MAMTYKADKTFLTVRELVAELQKIENQDAPVVTSKYSLADRTWESDGVTEIITGTKAKLSADGVLADSGEGEEVEVVVLY